AVSAPGARSSGAVFLDPRTMKLAALRVVLPRVDFGDGRTVRASANGRVFSVWRRNTSPAGIQTVVIKGTEGTGHYEHKTAGHLVPGPDGGVLYTGEGPHNVLGKALAAGGRGPFCLPAAQPGFFLSVRPEKERDAGPKAKHVLAVHLEGDARD